MTIDLDSTLIRAEVLFYRFQGTVEIIDRKNAERTKQGKDIEVSVSNELRALLKKDYPRDKDGSWFHGYIACAVHISFYIGGFARTAMDEKRLELRVTERSAYDVPVETSQCAEPWSSRDCSKSDVYIVNPNDI
jgi:hypothetical protein